MSISFGADYETRKLRYQYRQLYNDRMLNFEPSHLITISLFHPSADHSAAWLNERYEGNFGGLGKEVINRFDRFFYGKRHFTKPTESKYPFVGRLERASKFGTEIPAHFHFLTGFRDVEIDKLKGTPWGLESPVTKLLRQREFIPDFQIDKHSPDISDYILKNAELGPLEIFSREYPLRD